MNCTCRGKSAFLWNACNCPSIFVADFGRAAKTGMTQSQIATQTAARFERETGRSLGTVMDLSEKSNIATAQRNDQRRLVRQAKKKG